MLKPYVTVGLNASFLIDMNSSRLRRLHQRGASSVEGPAIVSARGASGGRLLGRGTLLTLGGLTSAALTPPSPRPSVCPSSLRQGDGGLVAQRYYKMDAALVDLSVRGAQGATTQCGPAAWAAGGWLGLHGACAQRPAPCAVLRWPPLPLRRQPVWAG